MVTFPKVQGASTDGADQVEAVENARDGSVAALNAHVTLGEPLPRPQPACCRATIALPPLATAKLELYIAMHNLDMTTEARAGRLGIAAVAVARLLDLDHRSHIGEIETALAQLGKRLEISARDVAVADEMLAP